MKEKMIACAMSGLWVALFFIGGCAGLKRGYFSLPYAVTGTPATAPPDTEWERNAAKTLRFQGLDVYVSLNNEIQTSDTQWLVLIPAYIDLKKKALYGEKPMGFHIWLALHPQIGGMSFEPGKIRLIVDGVTRPALETRQYKGPVVSHNVPCYSILDYNNEDLRQVEEKKIYPVTKKYSHFAVYFEGRIPSADQDIRLDISEAILVPGGGSIPVIRFKKSGYTSGYS